VISEAIHSGVDLVSGKMTVEASHHLTIVLTQRIEQRFPGASVTIHIEPCNGFCSAVCTEGCRLPAASREALQRKHREQGCEV